MTKEDAKQHARAYRYAADIAEGAARAAPTMADRNRASEIASTMLCISTGYLKLAEELDV